MGVEITMSSEGQVVIPKDVREALDLQAGEKLTLHRDGRRIILEAMAGPRERISYEEFRRRVPRYDGLAVAAEDMTGKIGNLFHNWRD